MRLPFAPPLAPMLSSAADALPGGEGWQFEPKWDGFRTLVFRDGDEILLQSRARTTATIYLSFFDPTGPANMLDSTSRLREPLLWVAGTADRSQPGPAYAFSHAPANPLNRCVTVSADHLGTPTAAREAVLAWLGELR